MSQHRFVDHVSELALHLEAPNTLELVLEAARALSQLLRHDDPGTLADAWRSISIEAGDTAGLLVDWLNELIYLAETDRWVPVEFQNAELNGRTLRLEARGVRLERAPSLIKAATFHDLEIRDTNSGVEAEVILDV